MFGQRFLNTYLEQANRTVQFLGDRGQVDLARAASQLHRDNVTRLPSAVSNKGIVKQQIRGPVPRKGVPPKSVDELIEMVQVEGSTTPGRRLTIEEHELPGFVIKEPY